PILTHASTTPEPDSSWPQFHTVTRLKDPDRLRVSNAYYTIEHDLKRGGAITSIALTYGMGNLVVSPVVAEVRDEKGVVFSEANDRAPRVSSSTYGSTEVLEVETRLVNHAVGAAPNVALKTRFEYHWGYIKIRKEFIVRAAGLRATAITPFQATF